MPSFLTIHKIILCAVFCCAANVVVGQYDYSIKNFNPENGLPLNEITCMTMDNDGYLWAGTRAGLVRYDGSSLRTFTFDNINKPERANYVIGTINTLDNKTVLRTRAGAYYLIENGKPVLYADTIHFRDGWTMYNGNFPSLATFNTLYLKSKTLGKNKVISFNRPSWKQLSRLVLPVDDNLFIIGNVGSSDIIYIKNGVHIRVAETGHILQQFLSSGQSHFLLDNQHALYLYDKPNDRFNKINTDFGAFKKTVKASEISFFNDGFSKESFCLYDGTFYLLQFDAASNSMKFVPQFSIKDGKHFWTGMVYDKLNSTFFLSTSNEGLFQVKLKKIKTFNINELLHTPNLNSAAIYAVLKTSDSTVIVPNGIQFTSGASGIKIKKLGTISGERETIALGKEKNILTTLYSQIYIYSPADGYNIRKTYNDSFTKKNNVAKVELIYPEGDSLWIGTDNQLFCITKNTITKLFDIAGDKARTYEELRLFYRINNSEAFITSRNGLFRLKTSYPFSAPAVKQMAGKQVRHISPYKDMFILSVHGEGLYVMKGEQFFKVPLSADQPELTSCHSTYIDKNGFLWICTDRGLYKTTVSSFVEAAFKPESGAPFFFSYGKADGIDNLEFNGRGMPPYAVLDNGQAFYPSMGGVVTFNVNELNNSIVSSAAAIEKILIDNKETGQVNDDSIFLYAGFKYLTIELSAANFGDAKNLYIEYNLDSVGWKKIPANEQLKITLVDINSGEHQLAIRKRTGFGKTDYTYTNIIIFKKKGIFEQVWIYLALLFILCFIIWLFLKWKTRNINQKRKLLQQKVNEQTAELSKEVEVKDLLISIISHDMVAPQRHVAIVAKYLKTGGEKDPEKVAQALSDIQSTSERILTGSTSIINWMKYNNKKIETNKQEINVRHLVNETMQLYIPLAKNKNIELINEVSESITISADYNIISTILTNIISNAVKYTDKGSVSIFTADGADGTTTILKIADTGRGMNEQKLHIIKEVLKGNLSVLKLTDSTSGLGYVMISELQKMDNLSLQIESQVDKGTTVSIVVNPG